MSEADRILTGFANQKITHADMSPADYRAAG
jgi:hypothetical protein